MAVDGQVIGAVDAGLLVFLGVAAQDAEADGEWLAQKIAALRIFPDAGGLMNRSARDVGGGVLVVSQFTLFASTRKGTRPSFNDAGPPDLARRLYDRFLAQMETALGRAPSRGEFGADMKVSLVNDGPVTLIIDSKSRE